jgi:hypothetical protein
MSNTPPSYTNRHPWIVEFVEPRSKNQQQANALQKIDFSVLHELIRIYLNVVLPDAEIAEPIATPIRTIRCVRRSDARKFIRTWGGRIIATVRGLVGTEHGGLGAP